MGFWFPEDMAVSRFPKFFKLAPRERFELPTNGLTVKTGP
jgi:hypothetical protein